MAQLNKDELIKVFRRHYEDLSKYTFDLSKKNLDFVNSISIASATIASFSLLTLQTTLSVNSYYLIFGFVILIFNVLFSFVIIRLWINFEESPIEKLKHSLENEERLVVISREDPNLKNSENKEFFNTYIESLISRQDIVAQRTKNEKYSSLLKRLVYFNLFIFGFGLFSITFSFFTCS